MLSDEERKRRAAASQRRYLRTEAGKATQARYDATPKGLATVARSRVVNGPIGKQREKAKIREMIRSYKSRPCMDCKRSYDPVCMDFDHRPGAVKLFSVGAKKSSVKVVLAEILKCDVVCSNCHRLRTAWRRLLRRPL